MKNGMCRKAMRAIRIVSRLFSFLRVQRLLLWFFFPNIVWSYQQAGESRPTPLNGYWVQCIYCYYLVNELVQRTLSLFELIALDRDMK